MRGAFALTLLLLPISSTRGAGLVRRGKLKEGRVVWDDCRSSGTAPWRSRCHGYRGAMAQHGRPRTSSRAPAMRIPQALPLTAGTRVLAAELPGLSLPLEKVFFFFLKFVQRSAFPAEPWLNARDERAADRLCATRVGAPARAPAQRGKQQ